MGKCSQRTNENENEKNVSGVGGGKRVGRMGGWKDGRMEGWDGKGGAKVFGLEVS